MNGKKGLEILAVIVTLLGMGGATALPFLYENSRLPSGVHVTTLTGVAVTGTWTDEEVNGGNYWRRTFQSARPIWYVGETVLLRLKSADVTHSFYCPGLGIGPLEVYPGHVVETMVQPKSEGVFEFYCESVCGDPHFGMRGEIVVQRRDSPTPPSALNIPAYWRTPPPAPDANRMTRGKWLFNRMGCVMCHGQEGRGGIVNPNYVKDTVPQLDKLAERMMLFEKEDAQAIIDALNRGTSLESLTAEPPVARFNVVLAQYNAIRELIKNGNPAGKKDPKGLTPPLEMPSWGNRLSDNDINSIIAYLLSIYPWEKEKGGKEK